MKETIRKIYLFGGYTFVGFVATGLTFLAVAGIVIGYLVRNYGGSQETYIPVAYLGIVPFSYMLGGVVTGYLSQPFIKRRFLNYLLISPAIYSSALLIILNSSTFEAFNYLVLMCGLLWNLFCFAGVALGIKLCEIRVGQKDNSKTPQEPVS